LQKDYPSHALASKKGAIASEEFFEKMARVSLKELSVCDAILIRHKEDFQPFNRA
jgi:hypothetical protein